MGMAASQVRLLQLTGRKNDIGRMLSSLSLQKTSLTREMRKVSEDYQNALSSKTLKWSNNSGVDYVDLSYSTLMQPGNANQNTPYLITDQSGKVVVDSKYEKYASMISPDGAAGGDYESNRASILSSLTGLSEEDIASGFEAKENVLAAADNVNQLQEEVDVLEAKCTDRTSYKDFMKKLYSGDTKANTTLGTSASAAKSKVKSTLDQISSKAETYLKDDDLEKFKEAINQTYEIYCDYIDSAGSGVIDTCPLSKEKISGIDQYVMSNNDFIDTILNQYRIAGGTCEQSSVNSDIYYYDTVDRNSTDYKNYESKKAELDAAKAEYESAENNNSQSFTSAEESQLNFYDQIFTAIAEKGWTCNPDVKDSDYLNQMLQNNQYYITTMESATDENGDSYYEYSSSIASNFDKVYSVNDTDTQNEAAIEYEYEKSIINEKESRIDTRMQDLETEQSAINEMIKGIESVRNDNTERTFSIFS